MRGRVCQCTASLKTKTSARLLRLVLEHTTSGDKGLSVRQACELLQIHCSTLQYQPRPERNAELAQQIAQLAAKHPRYGYHLVWMLLRRKRQPVHRKCVHRH